MRLFCRGNGLSVLPWGLQGRNAGSWTPARLALSPMPHFWRHFRCLVPPLQLRRPHPRVTPLPLLIISPSIKQLIDMQQPEIERCCFFPPPAQTSKLLEPVFLSYLLLGSAAFWALESPAERESANRLLHQKWDLLLNFTCLEREAFERLAENIIHAYKKGLYLKGNTTLGRWDFVGSFFFSVSAVTTIGYGNLSPTTVLARVFCIFFALFGIPLNLILLNRIGQLMLSGVQTCAFHLGEKFHWQKGAAVLIRTCALVAGLLLFLLLPPLLFTAIEGWTYEEGFYYSFITLSTIGFGDYVIGMNPERIYPAWYKNVVSLWILFGMAWLALIINLCISLVENSSGLCRGCKKQQDVEQELTNGNQSAGLGPADGQKCGMKDTKPVELA